jgi:hypothetical protein
MFNSYSSAYNHLKINATSGTLIKSHPKSFTFVYPMNSATSLHDTMPTLRDDKKGNRHRQCVVIQTMILSGNLMISEIVWLDDYLESEAPNE